MKLAVLVSGELGLKALQSLTDKHDIVCVMTDINSLKIQEFSRKLKTYLFVGSPRNGSTYEIISKYQIDVLLSINYVFLIEADLIKWPNEFAINFHGSLLPRYRGRTPHVWAIINNEKITGITAHLIDSGCDTGDIIEQISIPIPDNFSGNDLLNTFNYEYPGFIERVLEKVATGNIKTIPQDHSKATYFGKRTPNDGLINWDWTKERIYNWVRAQTRPYPGAFTWYRGKKIIIFKINFSPFGFDFRNENGLIVKSGNKPVVKTPNGCIELDEIGMEEKVDFFEGDILK